MAHDERTATFHGGSGARGHAAIGIPFSARIFRKLYHARYLPESFRALVTALRDPEQNPEWRFVEREVEIWMTKTDS